MITIEEYYMIKGLKNKGMSIMQISREMGVDRKTVSNWLKRNEPPAYRIHQFRQGKLDPFKDYILERMNEGCVNYFIEEILCHKKNRCIVGSVHQSLFKNDHQKIGLDKACDGSHSQT